MPHHISIDLTALLPVPTGCDVYMLNLVKHLGRVDTVNRYDLYVNTADRNLFNGQLPSNFTVIPLSFRPRLCRLVFQQGLFPLAATLRGSTVLHSPSFLGPLVTLGKRHVVTVHDMTFFSLPDLHIPLRRSSGFKNLLLRTMRSADAVLVPSVATRDHIGELGLSTSNVVLTPYGVGDEFILHTPEETAANAKRLKLPPSYILAVGTIEPRKNLGRLIDAYLQLVRDHNIAEHLVLAGRLGWNYEEILQKLEAPELQGRVHRPGFVPAADLPWYYAAARLCAYPSIQEGFGFPPLEAMASGIPVVSSVSSSLTENLEGAAELAPPNDTAALASAILRVLQDPDRYARLRQTGLARAARFRWDETARSTIEVYTAVD